MAIFVFQTPQDVTQALNQNLPAKRSSTSVDSPQEPKRSRHSSGAVSLFKK